MTIARYNRASMSSLRNYQNQIRRFGPNAKLYLLYSFSSGFSLGILGLLFNFYVLSLGYSAGFLGVLVALPPIVITVAAIPAGMLGQRIGYRTALIGAAALMTFSLAGLSLSSAALALLGFAILRGVSQTMLQVSNAPFMAENSGPSERTHLFSVQFATRTLSSFFGFLVAGVMPSIFARFLSVGVADPLAYRASLLASAGLFLLSILPLLRMPKFRQEVPEKRPTLREMFSPPGPLVRLFAPQAIIGLGAGMVVPFLNVYLRTAYDLSDGFVGVLFAFQSLAMAVAILIGPLVAERLSRIRTVIWMQLLSIPFLITLGYIPILWLAAVALLARAGLMNMANPLYTAFAMESVSADKRSTASALMEISWQGTRGISAMISGQIQATAGFSALFPITIACYLTASGMIWRFFGNRARGNAPGC